MIARRSRLWCWLRGLNPFRGEVNWECLFAGLRVFARNKSVEEISPKDAKPREDAEKAWPIHIDLSLLAGAEP